MNDPLEDVRSDNAIPPLAASAVLVRNFAVQVVHPQLSHKRQCDGLKSPSEADNGANGFFSTRKSTGNHMSFSSLDSAPTSSSTITIELNEREEQLFSVLQTVAEEYNALNDDSTSNAHEPLVVRIAGGWVRDKILGLSNDDIDIAINRISGVQFAQLIQTYVTNHPEAHVRATNMGIVASNPEQSKHLETACMRLCHVDIDITHLRGNELYDDPQSRIPTVEMGTPLEDAHRRDFTINALFYNLQTQCIEDYTGRGLLDLQNRILETPLDPTVTFLDDPLRILRAVRFAIRFQMTMDAAMVSAAQDPNIQTALQQKVSRERVGKELEGMLSGKSANALQALQTMHQLHLSSSMFILPIMGVHCNSISGSILGIPYPTADSDRQQQLHQNGYDESQILAFILPRVWESHNVTKRENESSKQVVELPVSIVDRRLLPLAIYLLTFRTLYYTDIPKSISTNSVEKQICVVTFMVKDGLKFKNTDVHAMSTLMNVLDRMIELIVDYASGNAQRLSIGLLVRETKDLWVTALVLGVVLLIRQQQRQAATGEITSPNDAPMRSMDWMQMGNALYTDIVYKFQLDQCWNTIRPLFNGKELIQILQIPHGPLVGIFMEEQTKYRIQYPDATPDDCRQHLLRFREAEPQALETVPSHASKKKKKT
jgi:tRNA nucleotidyltransferase (CCA-adding enzyme)